MSVHVNQVGYGTNMPKKAVITGKGERCMLLDARKIHPEVITPVLGEARYDVSSGDTVRVVDFSAVTEPGEYFLFADGDKMNVTITGRPFRDLTNALVKGMYYQRCGCPLHEEHAGDYKHAICHEGIATGIDDDSIKLEVSGGWHDAGDYGRYIVPGAVAVSHMMYAYEMFPNAFRDELTIPESGNGIPDILDECRFELEWMLKMQRADGALYHKVTSRFFADFIMPEDDMMDLVLFDVSHCAAADFAAAMAQGYRVFKGIDANFANTMLEAAKRAWKWLEANPEFKPFKNPPKVGSGEYGDEEFEDDMFWAACEMYTATGESTYLAAACQYAPLVTFTGFGRLAVAGLGALNCLFINSWNLPADFLADIRKRFLAYADASLKLSQDSGYGTSMNPEGYIWGSTLHIMSNGIVLIGAKLLTGEQVYEDAALTQLDYILGLNCTGFSFVTGFGEKAFRHPHHRPSFADGIADPVPGLVSGGPNGSNIDREITKVFPVETTPPAKCYADYAPTASNNETAIYWNSSTLIVAAYFDCLTQEQGE